MAKIHILPEQIANRIAAGEVVERPASVVKELVENSLDAGADRIEIETEGGGTRLIRVLDNGTGMDEDDVLLSFERHGTSKIHANHDLVAINTLGFRGEAIPSIASVSKMTIISRTEDNSLGSKVVFDYGLLQSVHETGCSIGTIIEVRNLFGRTPARKKFLRTARTEIGHIDEIVKNYALACPNTAFTLKVDQRETIRLDSGHDLEQRLRSVLKYQGSFIPVGEDGTTREYRKISGFLIPPEQNTTASARLRLFINGRAIRDRLMSHAVFEGLRGFLLKGHSPAGYLHLRIPPEEIDVNVHPAKHEVRFRNSGDIHQFIKQSVITAMHGYQQSIKSAYFHHRETASPDRVDDDRVFSQSAVSQPDPPYPQRSDYRKTSTQTSPKHPHAPLFAQPAAMTLPLQTHEPIKRTVADATDGTPEKEPHFAGRLQKHGIRVIGQYKNLYIFCEAGEELLVIDQHAAHERILFEKYRRQYLNGKVSSQTLLFPETVELSPLQTHLVESNGAELEQLGFAIREFGGNSYVISAVPALTGQRTGKTVFFDVLERFGSDTSKNNSGGVLDDILATMACKAAVKSGDKLSPEEIDALLTNMAETDLFSHCPHGRPVFKTFSDTEIQKWFHRT
ncbi:MAG: DNA mismatch repair endonuclease MutL [Desulfopila sp.]|jgi:DNA mismatch repair protein MutL|nr:DNA mismatch repair endonuclease MutL [Desulfopila sp.]